MPAIRLFLAALLAAALPALATPQYHNATDIWLDPATENVERVYGFSYCTIEIR